MKDYAGYTNKNIARNKRYQYYAVFLTLEFILVSALTYMILFKPFGI